MIVGTAGHVDHGKTALIQRLTGIDTDRLKEEKARGLTIEAGFAYPEVEENMELGFVDVPGHQRFLHNMLAGSAGIDTVLLVVAADDGVMPQTIEHVQILDLLGVDRGVVALTKIDRVDETRRQQVKEDITRLLAGTRLAGAPLHDVSSHSGEGVAALRDALWSQAARQQAPSPHGNFRLGVDRVFAMPGAGLIVTGTALSGCIAKGDTVRLVPDGNKARVRQLRRQNQESEQARQGDRVALNLAGAGIERNRINRGDWIVADTLPTPPLKRLDVQLRLLDSAPPLKHWTPVHIHLGAAHLMGRVSLLEGQRLEPGKQMLGQLVCDDPVHACLGDRFVIRDHGGHMTLGGGIALDGDPPRRGQRTPARLAWLATLAECASAAPPYDLHEPLRAALVLHPEGQSLNSMARTLNISVHELASLVELAGGQILAAEGEVSAFSREAIESLKERITQVVADNHQAEPAMLGTERERLNRQAAPRLPAPLFRGLLKQLITSGQLDSSGPFISLPGHRAALKDQDETIWQRLEPLLSESPFQPPRVRDLAAISGLDEQHIRQVLTACARLGRLYQVRKDHFYLAAATHELAAIARDVMEQHGTIRVAAFRNRIGTGRKLAIHILEFFDRIGFTRRVQDERCIRRTTLWN
ncbi:selenocysteine-specific translation elongation factor [Halomonas aquamarina]|uniref:Selenocysteine-specific translation elongation factor n=1 Tax=Vreelandella aquamarina TaxID=77097 RepID=A0ACC5VS61_9GAMM|nr:selenocysteine-specific translation elongation factor [Halomonas aquamarina]MBZ5486805.1 selenocysteine-specific translation elongation factor [Halomonas aquamarina]